MNGLTKEIVLLAEKYLNKDPFVIENIKYYDLVLLLKSGENEFFYKISNGSMQVVDNIFFEKPTVEISGNKENWTLVISGLHGGLHRAFRHKILKFEGDPVTMLSIWKTLWRVGEALSVAYKEESHALQ